VLRGVATLLLYTCAGGAAAQFSGTLSAVTDYRYRGITFSDRDPAVQAGLAYDDPQGWFVGGFGSTVRLAPPGGTTANLQAIVYAGYAVRLPSGISVEAGGDYAAFVGANDLNYGEVFVGGTMENLGARIYFSPRYFGQSSNAIYGELNASQPLIDRVSLHAHAGLLRYRYDSPYGIPHRAQSTQNIVDGRIGFRFDLDLLQFEIAWVGVSNHGAAYLITGSGSPNGIVGSVSLPF
jgi:uncharacterized protein (TIGR02001 family)